MTFNIISHIFPENLIETYRFVHNVRRFSSSTLTIFIDFLDILTFPCYKETNDVRIQQMMPVPFYFQHALKRLFNTCIKIYLYYISSSWNVNMGAKFTHQKETPFKKPSLIRISKYLLWRLLNCKPSSRELRASELPVYPTTISQRAVICKPSQICNW